MKNSAQAGNITETREKLGQMTGVSHDNIMKVKKLSGAADDETKQRLRRNESLSNRAYTDVIHREHADGARLATNLGTRKRQVYFSVRTSWHKTIIDDDECICEAKDLINKLSAIIWGARTLHFSRLS